MGVLKADFSAPIFIDFLRQQKLLLASVEQQPPILFLRQKHWSFVKKNTLNTGKLDVHKT